jgi:L-amino acid N-acyltransferase YncA
MIGVSRNSSKSPKITVRACEESDMHAITEIYRQHVLTSPATFEIDPPSCEEMEKRRRAILESGFVYLVAEQGETIIG